MKKLTIFTILLFLFNIAFADLAVDKDELAKGREIEFINYTGPRDFVNTYEEIRGVGVYLGADMTKESTRRSYYGLYTIIHVYDPTDTSGRLDADIFIIEPYAPIDHINTVRVVLAGYLQSAYGYSHEDALILAKFVTYYNAVFRGNLTYFQERYKNAVTTHLAAANCGISTLYSDWAGATRMLIPLSEGFEEGKLSSLETEELTEEEVIEELREEEDKGVEDRKEITELEERQLEEEEKELEEEKEQLEEDRRELEEEREELTEEEIAERERELGEREEEIKERERELGEREEEIREDREDIVHDERKVEEEFEERREEEEETTSVTILPESEIKEEALFLKITEGAEDSQGELLLLDFKKDSLLSRSKDITIKERRLIVFNNALLVIAEPFASGVSYLMILDSKTLTVTSQSVEEVFARSIFTTIGNAVYAVVKKDNTYYIGKFDSKLKLTNTSAVEVNPYTPLLVSGNYLYVQSQNGKVLKLKLSNLSMEGSATLR